MIAAAGGHAAVLTAAGVCLCRRGHAAAGGGGIAAGSSNEVVIDAIRLVRGRNGIAVRIGVRVPADQGAICRAAAAKSEREAREDYRGCFFHIGCWDETLGQIDPILLYRRRHSQKGTRFLGISEKF